jgi:hypothetical protein
MKSEKIMLENKEIEVKELKVKHIKKIMKDMESNKDLSLNSILEYGKELLPSVSNITIEEIEELAFSDVDALLNLFWKVNASFLKLLKQLGITKNFQNLVGTQEEKS